MLIRTDLFIANCSLAQYYRMYHLHFCSELTPYIISYLVLINTKQLRAL